MSDQARHGVRIEWVVSGGAVVHVSKFAGVPVGCRPTVTCPHCDDALVLRLGDARAWHAAHQPGASCVLASYESALHYNTKYRLHDLLRDAASVKVLDECRGQGPRTSDCTDRVRDWLQGWDRVEVERAVGSLRPDLTLWRGEELLGAIEVLVTHQVGKEKAAILEKLGVPWVEVDAADLRPDWRPTEPLPCRKIVPRVVYTCDVCVSAATDARRREREESERKRDHMRRSRERESALRRQAANLQARMRSNGVLAQRLLVFDHLLADGKVDRDGIVIADTFRGGRKTSAFVGVLGSARVLGTADLPTQDDYRALRAVADEYLTGHRGRVDPHVGWLNVMDALKHSHELWGREADQHRWSGEPGSPWRVEWSEPGLDSLDLLRFYFVRYLSGLPVRYWWSRNTGRWFLPDAASAPPWQLLPPAPSEPGRSCKPTPSSTCSR